MTTQQVPPRAPLSHHDETADRYRGTFRVRPPHETWARVAPLLARAGITRLTDHTGLDELGIPVFAAVRPAALCDHYALGKGTSALLSRISAAMEGLEVWHAETHRPDRRDRTRHEVAGPGEEAVGPDRFATPTGTALGAAARLDWTRGTSLTGVPTWVPHDAVRLGSRTHRRITSSTNGLASGNTYDEAVLHGLLEVCERDAIATFLRDHRCRTVEPAGVTDPECRALLDRYAAHGFEVVLLDVTNDLGVPTVLAFVGRTPEDWIFCGAGAHLSRAVAISRALTEAAQLRLIVRLGIRDDVDARFDRCPGGSDLTVPSWVATDLAADGPADDVRSLGDDVARVGDVLARRRGLDPVVVDLTRADTGLPVVRVLAPGAGEELSFFGPRLQLPLPEQGPDA